MSDPLVLALVSQSAPRAALAAGFEEEGVPLTVRVAEGTPHALAREAARLAVLGLGLSGDAEQLVLVLAAAPGSPYVEGPASDARDFAQNAARVAAHRPLRYQYEGGRGVKSRSWWSSGLLALSVAHLSLASSGRKR